MKKRKLDAHAEQIRMMLSDGASNSQIQQALMAMKVEVSLETVRTWVISNPEAARLKKRGKGRPKSDYAPLFNFLPEDPAALGWAIGCPSIFRVFLDSGVNDLELRMATIAQAIMRIGIPVDQDLPLLQWTIPARVLTKLHDLEICFMAFLLSGLLLPPIGNRDESLFVDCLQDLTLYASVLKARIKKGGDMTVGELFIAIRGCTDECPPS
ncbi:MAG: hypothetical protein WCP35_21305 [Verrucomicrobiota bacterium]